MKSIPTRKISYGVASFLLGAWAFKAVNEISGPAFEPIVAACTNPEYGASMDKFVKETGYHAYEPRVGLVAFNFLVCLITQFLLELRETYPAGLLVWCGVIVVAMPYGVINSIEGGRKGARGPIRYPTIMGLLMQLLGISVIVPLIWLPSFIVGEGTRKAPITTLRTAVGYVSLFPAFIFTLIVFTVSTDSWLWTICAGMLGGPVVVLINLLLFRDKSCEISITKENVTTTSNRNQYMYKIFSLIGFVAWYILVGIAVTTYDGFGQLWNDIWIHAGPSVAFMTIDTGVLYLALLMYVAYRGSEWKALKAFLYTFVVGPATAICWISMEIENETEISFEDKKEL